jgi:DNA-binding NarL/FixJ family response regulator
MWQGHSLDGAMKMTGKSIKSAAGQRPAVRILIVDDHPIVREGLTAILSAQPDLLVCGEASNTADALKQVRATAPDIAVVDIALNGESGLDLVRQFKALNRSLRILVVSMYDDNLYAERALEAGALGYLNKQVASRHIIAAIRRLLAGQQYLSDEMQTRLSMRHSTGLPAGARQGMSSLTDRELEVFRLIGAGLTTTEIAEKLFLSVKTVESHRLKIKSKLDLRTAAELGRAAAQFFLENGG